MADATLAMAGADALQASLDILKQQRDAPSMAGFALELVGGGIDDARELLRQAAVHLAALLQPTAAVTDESDKKRPAPDDGPKQTQTKAARSQLEATSVSVPSSTPAAPALTSSSSEGESKVVDLNYYKMDSMDDSAQVLMLLVPDATVSTIIGKAGVTIKQIQSSTDTKIDIQTSAEMVPGQHERLVLLKGTIKKTNVGAYLVGMKVAEKLQAAHQRTDVADVLKMLVPDHLVSSIIGRQGVNVNQIQSQSSARVQIEKASEMLPGLGGRAVAITGSTRARLLAQYLISRSVSQHPGSLPTVAANYGPTTSDPELGHNSMEMFAQNNLMARLIGKQGKNIAEIQTNCGANVQIEKESEMVSSGRTFRKITLIGTQAAISHGHSLVAQQLAEWQAVYGTGAGPTPGAVPEQPRPARTNFPPPVNYAPLAAQQHQHPGALLTQPHAAVPQPHPAGVPAPAPTVARPGQSIPAQQPVHYQMPPGYGYTAVPGTHPPAMVSPGAANYPAQPTYHYPPAHAQDDLSGDPSGYR